MLELLAAVGLILPAVVDIAPVMVPVTAGCWVLLMVGAMITHARLGQSTLVLLNLVHLALAAFIARAASALSPWWADEDHGSGRRRPWPAGAHAVFSRARLIRAGGRAHMSPPVPVLERPEGSSS
ncbi:DoxX family protein [Modestobacter marinus]|uniref:DoxX family protein n=1 Tax=Modestobacter marinus TaxID=477641 RepID=UPI001C961B25|nr:DoxX family protein [Modestobacter marinus]